LISKKIFQNLFHFHKNAYNSCKYRHLRIWRRK
jgi:hypothetical protein